MISQQIVKCHAFSLDFVQFQSHIRDILDNIMLYSYVQKHNN